MVRLFQIIYVLPIVENKLKITNEQTIIIALNVYPPFKKFGSNNSLAKQKTTLNFPQFC